MTKTKITLAPAPWGEDEERTWGYLVRNKLATAGEVALNCDVPEPFAQGLIDRIGTPREVFVREAEEQAMVEFKTARTHTPTLDTQVGGSHYKDMKVQPWEAMEAWMTPEEYRGYHKGVAIAYLAREQSKGGDEDIEKAIHHLQHLTAWLKNG